MVTTTWSQTAGMTSETGTDNIEDYAEQAEASKDAAAASETAAASSASAASTSASSASTDAASALSSKNAAATSETNAATSEANAASSSATASTAATNASTSASNSASSATASANSASAAATSETNAATSETNAAASETAAAGSATSASTSETNAATSATNAAASETAAATSETNAATSETNAATSETNAATSETNAATSETNAASSATAAASSASAASSSATSASNAQTAAESARDATLAAYDNFDDRYLGTKASDPTVDNDGNPLVAGSIYFNSVSGAMRVYTGSAWVAAYVSGTDYLPFSGGTMTGDIAYGDNVKATFGASADLQVYHDGSSSFIKDVGTGDLQLQGTNVGLRKSASEYYVYGAADGAVTLYHDGNYKLVTTSSGINVTGKIEVTGGGSSLFDNTIRVRDDTNDTKISFERSDTGAGGWIGIPSWDADALKIYGPTASGNEAAANYTNQSWSLYGGGSVRLATSSSGIDVTGTVVADGLTVDGGVLKVDSTNNRVGVNQNSPSTDLHISHPANNTATLTPSIVENLGLRIKGDNASNTTGNIYSGISLGEGYAGIYGYDGGSSAATGLGVFTGTNADVDKRITVDANGDISFYEDTGTTAKLVWDASAEELQLASGVALELNGWTITESGGSLYFATGGTNKMKLDASGNLDVVGSVNSNATIS